MTSTSGGYNIGPSSHSYNPFAMHPPSSSSVMPAEQRSQRWNPYINGQNVYTSNQPFSQQLPNQQVLLKSIYML